MPLPQRPQAAVMPVTATMQVVPELPDVELYAHALRPRLVGRRIDAIRLTSPFLVRTTTPDIQTLVHRTVAAISRLGKRIVIDLDGPYLVIHLMIAGRFQWKSAGAAIPGRLGMMAVDVPDGTLLLTEAGSTRRAAVHVAADRQALARHGPGRSRSGRGAAGPLP